MKPTIRAENSNKVQCANNPIKCQWHSFQTNIGSISVWFERIFVMANLFGLCASTFVFSSFAPQHMCSWIVQQQRLHVHLAKLLKCFHSISYCHVILKMSKNKNKLEKEIILLKKYKLDRISRSRGFISTLLHFNLIRLNFLESTDK